jgi:hypothetical protein
MTHFFAPIALVGYIVAAIVGSCFAILLSAAWVALDRAVTRLAMRRRAGRPKAITIIRVNGRIVGRNR